MNVFHISVITLAMVSLSACSTPAGTDSRSFDYKAPPVKERALDVPPDLTSQFGDDRYGIPGESDSVTSFSEFSRGGANRKANSVLPPARNVRLERKDGQRWLVVNDTAENIWPVVKAFWQENGLVIKIDDPQAGILETDWSENRAKIPMDGLRKILGKVMDGLYGSGERDQFHTRLERGKDGKSTEIYIAHYGMQELMECDQNGYRWVARPADRELEATMLQLLMSKLGGGSGVLDSVKKTELPGSNGAAAPKLSMLSDGSQSILLNETFDKSWRKAGLALEQAGFVVADRDRSKGVFYLSAGKVDNKSNLGADDVMRTQVTVIERVTGCEIFVKNGAGASNSETQKIVDALFKSLGKI